MKQFLTVFFASFFAILFAGAILFVSVYNIEAARETKIENAKRDEKWGKDASNILSELDQSNHDFNSYLYVEQFDSYAVRINLAELTIAVAPLDSSYGDELADLRKALAEARANAEKSNSLRIAISRLAGKN